MKCFVHIGTEKTGTTAIQHFLHLNRDLLKQYGYFIPISVSLGIGNNTKLAIALYNTDRRDEFTKNYGILTDQQFELFQKKIIQKLKSELSHNVTLKKVIFSSEHFQSRLRSFTELKRLKAVLNQLGFQDISIIVYLRKPAELATSMYSTAIKTGLLNDRPPPPSNEYFRNICDHRATLKRFSDVFGEQSIIPRLYDTKEFKGGSILIDFLDCVGFSNSMRGFEIPDLKNPRLSKLGIEILRRINSKIPPHTEDGRFSHIRAGLVPYIESRFQNPPYKMPADLYQIYETEFYESNEWVRKRYFPERDQLFSPRSNKIKDNGSNEFTHGLGEQDLDKIADLIASIWLDKSNESYRTKLYQLASALRKLKNLLLRN